jgi:hypothetical protein
MHRHATTPLRFVGVARAAAGLLFIVRPSSVAANWVAERSPGTEVLTRSVGARDLVIGTGLAISGRAEWLAASVAADLADGADALIGSVPEGRRRSVLGWAYGFAAIGVAAGALARATGSGGSDRDR